MAVVRAVVAGAAQPGEAVVVGAQAQQQHVVGLVGWKAFSLWKVSRADPVLPENASLAGTGTTSWTRAPDFSAR